MRTFCALLFLFAAAHAAESQPYPLWDGQESIEQYAKRVNLPPTKTLDLGGGVKLEMVLIPAGKFTMGTPEPPPVDEAGFRRKILTGQVVLAIGGGSLVFLLGVILVRAIRTRQRPQYSLKWLLLMTVSASVGLLGGLHWRHSREMLSLAEAEHWVAMALYNEAPDNEKPSHEVTLSVPFYLGKYEVTQEQYMQIIGTNPSAFRGPNLPMDDLHWDSAQKFCQRTTKEMQLPIRLPTEAEWEFACRAGKQSLPLESHTVQSEMAWCSANSGDRTHPVGEKTPNAWGLYDMHGNVKEWCQDFYESYKAGNVRDPKGAIEGDCRVSRGGSCREGPRDCTSTSRVEEHPWLHSVVLGFRVVLETKP